MKAISKMNGIPYNLLNSFYSGVLHKKLKSAALYSTPATFLQFMDFNKEESRPGCINTMKNMQPLKICLALNFLFLLTVVEITYNIKSVVA